MISCNKGDTVVKGSASQILSEFCILTEVMLETLNDDDLKKILIEAFERGFENHIKEVLNEKGY